MRAAAVALLLALVVAAPLAGSEEQQPDSPPITVTARIMKVEPPALGLALREWQVPTELEYPRLLGKLEAKLGPEARTTGLVAHGEKGTRLSIALLNRASYVRDHELVEGIDGLRKTKPILGMLSEGVTADLRATCGPDGESVVVEALVTAACLKRPIQTFATNLSGPPIIIELPEVDITRVRNTVSVPLTGGAILRTSDRTYLVLTANTGDPESGISRRRRRR